MHLVDAAAAAGPLHVLFSTFWVLPGWMTGYLASILPA